MNGAHVINLDEYEAIHVAAENVTYFNSFGVKHTPKEIKQEYIDWNKKKKQLDISTYHYGQNHGKLIMQSHKNGQKPQFRQFFYDFNVKYLQIADFCEK